VWKLVLLNTKWYATRIKSICEDATECVQEDIDDGNIVVLGDDLEWIMSELNIDSSDVKIEK
jgi:hypothetical protein